MAVCAGKPGEAGSLESSSPTCSEQYLWKLAKMGFARLLIVIPATGSSISEHWSEQKALSESL